MSGPRRKLPALTLHKHTGQAVVRLDGRDIYLGKFGTPESREKYERTIAEWLASRSAIFRNLKIEPAKSGPALTVSELLLAFWKHAQEHYRAPDGSPSEELGNVKAAIRAARLLYGLTPADEFGPLALRAVRERLIADGLMRTTINGRVNRIRRAFKWAASLEMIPVATVQALGTVAGLQKGRTAAREPEPVKPVPITDIDQVLPLLPRPVAGMVRLQLLTGMRPGEACAIRSCDLTPGDGTWTYRPESHKTAWRGKAREIVIGPKAQELLATFAKDDPAEYLFDPRAAVAEHHARRAVGRKSKPTPGELARRKAKPGAGHQTRYTRASYLNAIGRACERAGVESWTPNQLRHNAATEIRARFGLVVQPHLPGQRFASTVVAPPRSGLMAPSPGGERQRLLQRVHPAQHQPHQQPTHLRNRQRDQLRSNFFSTIASAAPAAAALSRHRNAARMANANIDSVMCRCHACHVRPSP